MAKSEVHAEDECYLLPEEDKLLLEALLQYEATQMRLEAVAEKLEEGEKEQVERAGETVEEKGAEAK